ncbi:oxysterol-binding protein-related protein 11 isoform X2 [Cydia pomonella]|uniref:oxysterol-binding protein-related protein 11 isoform X2 n=1 Tax=Cydia pomonella TaxID=82600 RepID=UPI002ADE0F93|nr:oxysterol-binding protein-related protein 11 isoform X2 [Cydia pomonella]
MMKSGGLGSHRPLSGQLYKYTNVVKGWQQRWFAVDPETGVLSYYLFDGPGDTVQPGQPARGEAHLAAAVVCPSDEDSRTFTLNCASGDMLKLRATDARARQEWVDGLRAIAEIHTKAMGANPPLQPREQLAVHGAMASARQQLQQTELRYLLDLTTYPHKQVEPAVQPREQLAVYGAIGSAPQQLLQIELN